MRNYVAVLAALSTTGALAQTTPPANAPQSQAQAPAQPQTVKKRVCTRSEETGSRVGGGKVCKIIEVPAKTTSTGRAQQQQPQSNAGASNSL